MEAVKSLEAQPRRTPRRRGRGTLRWWRRELERPSLAETPCDVAWSACPITGVEPGSGSGARRESEAVVVPIEPGGQHNRRGGEGRRFVHAQVCREGAGEGRFGQFHPSGNPEGGIGPVPSAC